jgi:hypothetical protein
MPSSPLAFVFVEAAGQQGCLQEQVHLLVGVVSEPLQRLQINLHGSGGGGVSLGGLAGQSVLPG